MTAPVAVIDVEAAASSVSDAQMLLRTTALAAVRSGASVTDVAEAAHVARVTIYRWQVADGQPADRVEVRGALNAGLLALARHTSPAVAAECAKGISASRIDVKGRRLELAAKNADRIPRDGDDWAAIAHAAEVWAAAQRVRERTGKWPTRVRLDPTGGRP